MWSRSKNVFQPSIEKAPVNSFWGSKLYAKPQIEEQESSNSQPISFWAKYRYAKTTKSSTTTTTTTTKTTTTTPLTTTTTEETTTTSKEETTTWFDDLNDETCGKCESRFCTAVSNFARFSDHLLDGDHVIDVKFPNGWGIDSDWFVELYLSGNLNPLGVKGGIANAFILESSESQSAVRVCLGEEYEKDKTGKIFLKLNEGMPWIDETLLCNCREKESTTAYSTMATTTEAWFRTRQPKKLISTTKRASTTTQEITTVPIDTTTIQKTTTTEQNTSTNWLKTTTSYHDYHQASSPKALTTSNNMDETTTWTPIVTILNSTPDAPARAKTTIFDSTTWTNTSPNFYPTQAATTMFFRTKKDIEWYKKYSKWRHFLN